MTQGTQIESSCKLCNKSSVGYEICNSCKRREIKRVKFHNSRNYSKENLFLEDWLFVLKQHDYSCKGCHRKYLLLTLDHVLSLGSGGKNERANIQPLCSNCHNVKAAIETKLKGNKKKRQEAMELKNENSHLFY